MKMRGLYLRSRKVGSMIPPLGRAQAHLVLGLAHATAPALVAGGGPGRVEGDGGITDHEDLGPGVVLLRLMRPLGQASQQQCSLLHLSPLALGLTLHQALQLRSSCALHMETTCSLTPAQPVAVPPDLWGLTWPGSWLPMGGFPTPLPSLALSSVCLTSVVTR